MISRFLSNMHEGTYTCPVHGDVKSMYILDESGEKHWCECPECTRDRECNERTLRDKVALERLKQKWKESNIKEKFYSMTFDDYITSNDSQVKAKDAIIKIANGESDRSVLLLGGNGLGKTMLASLAIKKRGGAIYKMYEIVMRIKASYSSIATESEFAILKQLSGLPVLAIDEIGRQFGSESERNWLSYVIDERYEDNRPTILISNLKLMRDCSEEEKTGGLYIEKYLGKDSVSRLVECADIITIQGSDWRRKQV